MIMSEAMNRLAALRAEYERQLGQKLSMIDLAAIRQAEVEMSQCRECKGLPCRKKANREMILCVSRENGKIYTILKACRYCQYSANSSVKAGVPRRYADKSYADYIETSENATALKIAKKYAAEYPQEWLYLCGGCGTGKTFLVSLLAKDLILAGAEVVFTDFQSILEELKDSFDDKAVTASAIMEKYQTCEVLILDDMGTGYFRNWGVAILHAIINARYNSELRTVLTSNYDLAGLMTRLSMQEEYSAARIISRLREKSEVVYMGEDDWRG